jgi:hypothetical protein
MRRIGVLAVLFLLIIVLTVRAADPVQFTLEVQPTVSKVGDPVTLGVYVQSVTGKEETISAPDVFLKLSGYNVFNFQQSFALTYEATINNDPLKPYASVKGVKSSVLYNYAGQSVPLKVGTNKVKLFEASVKSLAKGTTNVGISGKYFSGVDSSGDSISYTFLSSNIPVSSVMCKDNVCDSGEGKICSSAGDDCDIDGDGVSVDFPYACETGKTVDCKDNCPLVANPDQKDFDKDGIGDACDDDDDNDGVKDINDKCPETLAGTAVDASGCSAEQNTKDGDGDGIVDGQDNCPLVANPDQKDFDKDGIGDACDDDDDNDGVKDINDKCPETLAGAAVDASGCSAEQNAAGIDSDNDGVLDKYEPKECINPAFTRVYKLHSTVSGTPENKISAVYNENNNNFIGKFAGCLKGDIGAASAGTDLKVDGNDIAAFVAEYKNFKEKNYVAARGDINQDGLVNGDDIAAFVAEYKNNKK